MKISTHIRVFWYSMLALLSILAVTGCDSVDDQVQNGNFTDSAVAGLSYSTVTESGVTDIDGRFTYVEGDFITFSVGGTIVGDIVLARGNMTPADLSTGAVFITAFSDLQTLISSKDGKLILTRLANIVVFLQSLDDDADPTNGINIPTTVAALFDGVQIDFDQSVEEFRNDPVLINIMHVAANAGYLSTAAIKDLGSALDHFYTEQGITYNFDRATVTQTDTNGDGSPESITTWTYDADGRIASESLDTNADGTDDSVTTWTYDANGNQLSKVKDTNADGTPDSIESWIYDGNGNMLSYSLDSNADGASDAIKSWSYDIEGNQITFSDDTNGDGSAESTITYSYNSLGRLLSFVDDVIPTAITEFSYDADDNKISESYDIDGDGTPEVITSWTYDASGNKTSVSYDLNGDGTPEEITTWSYDANDNKTERSIDANGDGTPDIITSWVYDASGNKTSEGTDLNGDGTDDVITTWTYDVNGNQTSVNYDLNADGISDSEEVMSWTYESGNWISLLLTVIF